MGLLMTLITWFIPSATITTMTMTTPLKAPRCTSASDDGLTLKDTGLTTSFGLNINGVPTDSTGPDTLIITMAIGVIMAIGDMAITATGGMGGNHAHKSRSSVFFCDFFFDKSKSISKCRFLVH